MCEKRRRLRAQVTERLTAAADEICALFERTIAEYEEELSRSKEENQRKQRLLDSALSPQVRLHRTQDFLHTETVKSEDEEQSLAPESYPRPAQDLYLQVKVKDDASETASQQEQPIGDENDTALHHEPIRDENDTALHHEPIRDENDTALHHEPIRDENDPALHHEPVRDENDPALHHEPIRDENDTAPHHEPIRDENETATEDWMQPWEPPAESEEGRGYRLNQSQTSDAAQTANSFFRNITNGCSVFVDEQMTLTELKRKLTTQNCPICGKSLKRDLWSHILGHTAERPFSCSVCNKGFTRKSSLTLHKSLHLTQKPFSCTVCGKGFTQKSHLKLHLDIHDKHEQKQKETVISKRTRKTKQAAAVQPKPRLNTEKREQNPGRDQSSPSPTGREKKRRKCRQASDQTRASKRLSPLSISQKGEECPVCGKVFNDLWKHMLLHTGERPFRCSVCRKGFTRVSTLTLHRRLHMKVKPYKCSICEREFTQNCSLKVHLAKHAKEDELVRLRAKPLAQQLRSLNLQKYFGTENDRNFEPQPSTSQ